MKPLLLITGNSGTGKSHLLHTLFARSGGRVSLLDTCFNYDRFEAPEPAECDALAVDHITTLLGARNVALDQARDWCQAYDKVLCVVAATRGQAERYVDIPAGSIELRVIERGGQLKLAVVRERETVSFDVGAHRTHDAADELLHHVLRALEQLGVTLPGRDEDASAEDAPTGI